MPVIAISRGTLAGAQLIAENVAAELKIPCISREIIVEAAHSAGVSENALVEQVDRPPSFFSRYSRERNVYLWHIRSALCEHAKQGSFVYHGHGGNFLLADISNSLRVRVVASMDFRIAAVMKSHGVDRNDAEKHIHCIDKYREQWARYLYGVDWRDPSFYDLILNIEKLGMEDASQALIQCARLERFAWTEESRQNVADVALSTRVAAALASGEELFTGMLEFTASANVLTISGRVRSEQAWQEVRAAAEKAIGDAELRFEAAIATKDFNWGYEHAKVDSGPESRIPASA